MQDDDQVDVPVADEPQAEAEQSEVTTETTDEAKTGQEAEADAEGADAAGDDGDEQEDGEKRKRRSGVDRLKRKIAELTAELELQRSRGPVPADSEAIRRAVEAEVGEPPKIEDFEDYFAYERAMTAYEIDRRLAEKEAKRNAAARQAQMTAAQQIALEDFREREAEVAKAIPDYVQTMAQAGAMPASDAVTRLVIESDKGPLLKYHLAKNPADLQRLNAMDPLSAARAIGRLEAKLSLPTANRTSKAPPPTAPIKGGAGPASDEAKLEAWLKAKYG
ncbi:hypothetical protein ACFFJB_14970 [Camelimonas abortus]|uniref:Scaffolding protein n=1 Tax=Camelimonas abortus TaxID=1017184 RepID=A0ABV7LI67_9HYPH